MRTLPRYVLTWLLLSLTVSAAQAADRPNIVMIFTDDQRADAVGYTGNQAVSTPHLDRLAKRGVVFNNCFVNTSICAVSRANLLAGQYPGRHGIDDFFKTFSARQLRDTVPGRLQRAGYQTAFFGKWGIGDRPDATHQGAAVFDYWAGQPMQTNFFYEPDCRFVNFDGFARPLDDLCDCPADSKGRVGFRNRIGKANLKDPIQADSTVVPMKVEQFLDGRDPDKPFCMMLFFKGPHSPFGDWDPAVEHVTDNLNMPVPSSATVPLAQREPNFIRKSLGAPSGMRYLNHPSALDQHLRDYYRLISSLDLGVGRVMEALEARGLAENTVVLFTSDNGHFKGEHGLAGKWLMYEPSLRVPGFIYDPRAEAETGGTVSTRPVITTDFSVTMLSLAGLDIPDSMTGLDLTRLAEDPNAAGWRQDVFYDHPYGHGGAIPTTVGVRTPRYSYIRYTDQTPVYEQVFDLQEDPNQLNNLIDSADPELIRSLRARCDELMKQVGPMANR
ncbi:MAG: sulfatase-like hydrolase/transferase [Planctomycetota bacterium]